MAGIRTRTEDYDVLANAILHKRARLGKKATERFNTSYSSRDEDALADAILPRRAVMNKSQSKLCGMNHLSHAG